MSPLDFEDYLKLSIPEYAAEKVRSEGLTNEEALRDARKTFQSLLPQGLATENHYLHSVVNSDTNQRVGSLWLAKVLRGPRATAFIYDFYFAPLFRGRGWGRELIKLAEVEAKSLGLQILALHVFGHNQIARKLYQKAGFLETNIMMSKDLSQ